MSERIFHLSEVLDETQLQDVGKLIDDIRAGGVKAEMLRHYLLTQREGLEAQGIDPNYLFYSLCYNLESTTYRF